MSQHAAGTRKEKKVERKKSGMRRPLPLENMHQDQEAVEASG